MPKYRVLVDVDENGGDDDVFSVAVIVEAETPNEALALTEARAAVAFGKQKVLGAWDARKLP